MGESFCKNNGVVRVKRFGGDAAISVKFSSSGHYRRPLCLLDLSYVSPPLAIPNDLEPFRHPLVSLPLGDLPLSQARQPELSPCREATHSCRNAIDVLSDHLTAIDRAKPPIHINHSNLSQTCSPRRDSLNVEFDSIA
ncbi:hypothetical protein HPP92_011041 [Vanilla planifolia]|uniref:Uncharacterized protein n=1 Tax=Vanilla planifolia TaxID=51239 RepID=A0A835R593_VANPL|nr:hypothetical protein HPP92_011041 [Vanilla planifolia]